MKLTYRGVSYEANFSTLEATQTKQIGLYRGAPLAGKQFIINQPRLAPTRLKYRGAEYTH